MGNSFERIEKIFSTINSNSPDYLKWARAFCKGIKSNPEINCINNGLGKEIEFKWSNNGRFLELEFNDYMIYFSYYDCSNDCELDEWFIYDDNVDGFYGFIYSFKDVYSRQTNENLDIDNIFKDVRRFKKNFLKNDE